MPLTSDDIRRLLTEKCPPTTTNERVYASIIMALADDVTKLQKQTTELTKAAQFLASYLKDLKTEPTVEDAPAVTREESTQGGPRDQTPFPAGAKTQVASAPATLDQTQAAAATPAVPTPDVSSSAATNAAPIPQGTKAKGPTPNGNGAKAQ